MIGWLAFVGLYRLKVSSIQSAKITSKWRPHFSAQLDQGDQRELDVLPGVGQRTAQKWIEDLSDLELRSKEDLEQLSGIGPVRAEKLAPFLLPQIELPQVDDARTAPQEANRLFNEVRSDNLKPKATKSSRRKKSSPSTNKLPEQSATELEETNRTPPDTLEAKDREIKR